MVRGLRSRAEDVERDLHVSAAQLFVLRELAAVPNRSVRDLAAVTMTTHSTVSQVVGQLTTKKLVTRTTDKLDKRRSVLRLTRQGAALLRKAPRAVQEDLIDGFALLTPSQRRALATGLEKWLTASGLSGAPPALLFDQPLLTARKRVAKRRK
jgi:DNA-binding MarR family transcriptional regulator